VTALVREDSPRDHIDSHIDRYAVGDQADPAIWRELLEDADALIHNSVNWRALKSGDLEGHIASNIGGSIRLVEAAHAAGARRVCFISSVATLHDILPAWNGVIDELHPMRPGTLYGAYKAAVESHLWAAAAARDMHCVALRPCGIYGVEPVRPDKSFGARPIRILLERGKVRKADCPGGGKFVHRDDVALAAVRSIERDAAAGRVFNLVDCYAKHTRFAEHAASAMGLDPGVVEPDDGPPAKNRFDVTAAREVLGVGLDRGDEGLAAFARGFVALAQTA
jgi:nucleoside-diphosphate-sugar epimerase